MKLFNTGILIPASIVLASALMHTAVKTQESSGPQEQQKIKSIRSKPRIQAAILLDVSGSMEGLINQAKLQLWNMVSVMGRGKCDGMAPEIEIALYEYGRQSGDEANGYIKQLSPFTQNLDSLSSILFDLTTYGGLEYCGQVIYTSLNNLNWDNGNSTYKVIFIAGNEDFLQGNIQYTKACALAKEKSVIVNTIYCGSRENGIREHWNLNGECGTGSFTNINQNAELEDIPTPYDDVLIAKNTELNNTYIGFGASGEQANTRLHEVDIKTYSINKSSAVTRIKVKASPGIYNNASWDLVDAAKNDKDFISKTDRELLTDSLKTKSTEELNAIVKEKSEKRTALQAEILNLSAKRDAYLAQKRKEDTGAKNQTLQSEIEKMIISQANRFGIIIH